MLIDHLSRKFVEVIMSFYSFSFNVSLFDLGITVRDKLKSLSHYDLGDEVHYNEEFNFWES